MKRAAKKDHTHNPIAQAMRDCGYRVAETHQLGGGFPDQVWCGINRRTGLPQVWLVEVKTGKGGLTPAEEQFHQDFAGYVHIVRTVDDALRLVGVR